MTLCLAIIALVVCFVNVCIASTTITETAAWHINGIESTTTVAEQAQLASVLVFLVRPQRSNPPPTCEPATETPFEVLPTCNPALRAPKSERARANHHLFAHQQARALMRNEIPKAMATVDDRSPTTENRRPTRDP
jgi:hypothetical protein